MTRRERLANILDNFGERAVRYHLDRMMYRRKYDALSDAALEELTRDVIAGHQLSQKLAKQNRERMKVATQ